MEPDSGAQIMRLEAAVDRLVEVTVRRNETTRRLEERLERDRR